MKISVRLYRESQQETLIFDYNLAPMVCPPQPWSTPNHGGYILGRSDLIRLPPQAYQQWDRVKESDATSLYPALDALNQLSSVAWNVNTKILDLAVEVFQNGGSVELGVAQHPSALPTLQFDKADDDPTLTKKEKYERFLAKMSHLRTKSEMYSLWRDTLYRLSLTNHVSRFSSRFSFAHLFLFIIFVYSIGIKFSGFHTTWIFVVESILFLHI